MSQTNRDLSASQQDVILLKLDRYGSLVWCRMTFMTHHLPAVTEDHTESLPLRDLSFLVNLPVPC